MRAAIVTGASSGIGLGIARALAADGYGVALAARSRKRLEELAAELGEAALAVPTDVRRRDDVERLVGATVARFGRIDVVVANAGIGTFGPLSETDEEAWDETIDVNLKGPYLLIREALPHLRESRGYVIGISSVAGVLGIADLTAYSASKWGLRGFLQSFLRETRGDGIRATAICPGTVATPMMGMTETPDDVIAVDDVVATVRYLLGLRPIVQVREIVLERTTA